MDFMHAVKDVLQVPVCGLVPHALPELKNLNEKELRGHLNTGACPETIISSTRGGKNVILFSD